MGFPTMFSVRECAGFRYYTYHRIEFMLGEGKPVGLMVAAVVYFVANTLPVSIIISLTEGKPYRKVWSECSSDLFRTTWLEQRWWAWSVL